MSEFKPEFIKSGPELPEYLKMYEISGQDPISIHSFDRYIKAKEQDQAIQQKAEQTPDFWERKIVETETLTEKDLMIKNGLESVNPEIQEVAARMVGYGSVNKNFLRKMILRNVIKNLSSSDFKTQMIAVSLIEFIEKDDRSFIIMQGLESPNWKIREEAAKHILSAPDTEIESLRLVLLKNINLGLKSQDVEVKEIAMEMCRYVGMDEITPLVLKGVADPNCEVQKAALKLIVHVPVDQRLPIFELGYASSYLEVQKLAMDLIGYLFSEKETTIFVRKGLENPNPEIQKSALKNIESVQETEVVPFVKLGLESTNLDVQKLAIYMIRKVPIEQRLHLIEFCLENPNLEIKCQAMEMFSVAPFEDTRRLEKEALFIIKFYFKNSDLETQKMIIPRIRFVPERERAPPS